MQHYVQISLRQMEAHIDEEAPELTDAFIILTQRIGHTQKIFEDKETQKAVV